MSKLTEYQKGVVAEQKDLLERIRVLGDFRDGSQFHELPAAERDRLHRQAIAMAAYATVLAERIEAFPA